VAVSPDGTRVYVTNNKDNSVSVIDTATNLVTATIPVGAKSVRCRGTSSRVVRKCDTEV